MIDPMRPGYVPGQTPYTDDQLRQVYTLVDDAAAAEEVFTADELEVALPVRQVARFQAICVECEWEGPERSDNLRALRDYDHHAQTYLLHGLPRVREEDDDDR